MSIYTVLFTRPIIKIARVLLHTSITYKYLTTPGPHLPYYITLAI